jgi:hypothetical protein
VTAELLKAASNAPNAVAPKPANQARLRATGPRSVAGFLKGDDLCNRKFTFS